MNISEMSFTSFIKKEIIEYNWTKRQLEILFLSFLRTIETKKEEEYIFKTTLIKEEKKINSLFLDFFSLKITPIRTKNLLKYIINDKEFTIKFKELKSNILLKSLDENKAFISGVFLGKGWINSPKSRFYHCEFRVKNMDHSLDVQEVLDGLGIKCSTIMKNNWYYTYIKKASNISTIISLFNASQSLMIFEDSRIERDFVATFKKMESIEEHNLEKTRVSSKKQIDAIKNIYKNKRENELSEDQRNIIKIRMEYPDFSLLELQMEFNYKYKKDISKSAINSWFKKIIIKGEK